MTTARVQPRPYTEESARATSRVTAEERERYIDWQYDLDDDLAAIESECRMPSERERQCHRENVGYGVVEPAPHKQPEMFVVSGYGPTPGEWRSYWRSLPDYDGPPMRAPSGLVVRFPAVEGIDEAERAARRELRTHLRAQGYGLVYPDDDRHDGMRAYRRFGVQMLFDRPDEGGRGWCPKLAGVQT